MINYKYSTLALAIVALLSGCGAEDNKSLSSDNNNIKAPILKGYVTIPALHVGMTAQGNYEYFDPNPAPRPEGKSVYRWLDANDAPLGSEQMLKITYPLLGEQVRFCVELVAQGEINNVGDEICSEPRQVEVALGEKPTAENVQLDDAAPTVGETLTGSYDYMHSDSDSEGESQLVWKMGTGGNQVTIPNATSANLELAPITQGKAVAFCVTPITNDTPVLGGEEVCSEATALVAAKSGTAPEAKNVAIAGDGFVGAKLEGSYVFDDADKDIEGTSKLIWKRDDVVIVPAVTTASYTAMDADADKKLTFCVTPIALTGTPTDGTEECSLPLTITKKDEISPIVTDVTISVKSGGLAEVDEVLVASYDYSQENGALEGESLGYWTVDSVKQDNCDVAQGCEYPLTQTDIGKAISFSVTPKTTLGTPGDIAHSEAPTDVMGIKLSGTLEYDKQLIAVVFGYDGDVATGGHWMIDTDSQDGPSGDDNRTSQGTGLAHTIGTRASLVLEGGTKANDYDWIKNGGTAYDDARNFVGKSVYFCLDTVSYDRKCVSAADFSEVKGGLYFDPLVPTKRGVEPIRRVDFGKFVYHRSLTVAEAALKADAGFGENIPDATSSLMANGIEWALFAQVIETQKPAVTLCRNLYNDKTNKGDWHLPISQFNALDGNGQIKYIPNAYEKEGNNPPTGSGDSIIKLTKEVITDNNEPVYGISPVFGWPIGAVDGSPSVPYGSASVFAKDGKYNVVRFYANGGTANNYTPDQAPLISCVSVQSVASE
jgi:hypothetical protein